MGNLADTLDGTLAGSRDLTDGIERAQNSLETSRELLVELGTILGRLQERSGNADTAP
jgi:hypothetical protein